MWLLNKLFSHSDQPTPRFAFQGTVNWMRGLAILTEGEFSHHALRNFYRTVPRRRVNEEADALAYECLVMSMHNASSIKSMQGIDDPYEIVRSAVVAWYYAIYYASKAMLAASSGADPQTHAATGKIWQKELVDLNLVKKPFSNSIVDITPANVQRAIAALRAGNGYDLNTEPATIEMALGCIFSYLKGTAEYERWRLEEHVRKSQEYKLGNFTSFRSNAAKALRDAKLQPANVNFLVQAFRYRGKANYRDAIYLSYGRDDTERVRQFVEDLGAVSARFSAMAAHYTAKRVVATDWSLFATDLIEHARFKLPFSLDDI